MNVAPDGTAPADEDVRQRRRVEGLPGDAEVLPPRESVSIFATGGFRDGSDGAEPSVSLSVSTGTVSVQTSLGVEEVAELQAMLEEALADADRTVTAAPLGRANQSRPACRRAPAARVGRPLPT